MIKRSFSQYLEEGVFDPSILKAIFLCGGTGSGKTTIGTRITGTEFKDSRYITGPFGLKFINSDEVFEYLLTKKGYSGSKFIQTIGSNALGAQTIKAVPGRFNLAPGTEAEWEPERNLAKKKIDKRVSFGEPSGVWSDIGRLGVVIDATADNVDKIRKQRDKLISLGYDTMMVFVNTSLPVALKRNAERSRIVNTDVAEEIWRNVQKAKDDFKQLFGEGNFVVVQNDAYTEPNKDATSQKVFVEVMKFAQRPVRNPLGLKWIADQLQSRRH